MTQPLQMKFLFFIFYFSAVVIAVIMSMVVLVLYRRTVLRNMLSRETAAAPEASALSDYVIERRASPTSAGAYAKAVHRLKRRLAAVYGMGILAVVLLTLKLRFFIGNMSEDNVYRLFLAWRFALKNDLLALLANSAIFVTIGIPLVGVMLAWTWKRALMILAAYLVIWSGLSYATIVAVSWANWGLTHAVLLSAAGLLLEEQVRLLALLATVPLTLLILTGNRRLRAVVPITLAGSLVFCAVLWLAFWVTFLVWARQLVPKVWLQRVGHSGVLFLITFVAGGAVAWFLLRGLGRLYVRKWYSDRQLLVDSWSVIIILFTYAQLGVIRGLPETYVLIALLVFLAYRVLIQLGLWLMVRPLPRPPSRRLLLLRTFGFQSRTEKLFDAIGQRWRFQGSVVMIAGTDLASRSIDPAGYVEFLGRRLGARFIRSEADLRQRFSALDDRPDPDGRYRINELYCGDEAWQQALVALLAYTDLVLMDLRGFTAEKRGCIFELQQLVERVPLDRIVLVIDDTTDLCILESTLENARAIPLMPVKKGSVREMTTLLELLNDRATLPQSA